MVLIFKSKMEYWMLFLTLVQFGSSNPISDQLLNQGRGFREIPYGFHEPQRFGERSINYPRYENYRGFDDFLATTDQNYQWCARNPRMCRNFGQRREWDRPNFQSHIKALYDDEYLPTQFNSQMLSDSSENLHTQTQNSPETTPEGTTVPLSSEETTSLTTENSQDEMQISTEKSDKDSDIPSLEATEEPEFGTLITTARTYFEDDSSQRKNVFNFGDVPQDTPISTGDVKGFPAGLTSSGVPINPALTILQDLKSPKDETSEEMTDELDDQDEEGFTVDDPDDFLSSIRFRPVKFKPFQVLEIFDHPIQAYPRLAKPVRADSILSLLNNNFADVLRELQEREMSQR